MNKLHFIILLPLIVLVFSACSDDDDNGTPTGTLEIFFEPIYGEDRDLISPITNFSYASGNDIRVIVSDMYLGNISLGTANETTVLSEIEYISMGEAEMDESTGLTDKFLVLNDVPAGSYSFFEFGVGVPPELNSKTPSDFGSSHPLSRGGNYWDAWDSYIFAKLEGRLDVNNDGSFSQNFIYHSGQDELYRILRANIPLTINEGGTTRLKIVIDHEKLLVNEDGEYVDIEETPIDHSAGDLALVRFIADNYGRAFSLELVSQ